MFHGEVVRLQVEVALDLRERAQPAAVRGDVADVDPYLIHPDPLAHQSTPPGKGWEGGRREEEGVERTGKAWLPTKAVFDLQY